MIKIETKEENNFIIKQVEFGGEYLYIKLPNKYRDMLTDRIDSFVYLLLFPMMEQGGEFVFDGDLSRSLYENLKMFNKIWTIWKPELYKPINIIANIVDDNYRQHNKKAVFAFSGGLDACYSLYKNYKKYDSPYAVMIHGADIPVKDKEQFELAFDSAKSITNDIGVDLIPVQTNFRDLFKGLSWTHTYGSVVMSILSMFSKYAFYGVMSSGVHITDPHPGWGTNPIIDRYMTSDTFNIIVDGYEHTRIERANFVKDWQAVLDNLRVCWQDIVKKIFSVKNKYIGTKKIKQVTILGHAFEIGSNPHARRERERESKSINALVLKYLAHTINMRLCYGHK